MNFFIRKICVELAGFSRTSAATAQIRQSGGNTGEFRGLSGISRASRLAIMSNQRVSRLLLACHSSE